MPNESNTADAEGEPGMGKRPRDDEKRKGEKKYKNASDGDSSDGEGDMPTFQGSKLFPNFPSVFSAFIHVYMYMYIECVCLRACGRVFVWVCGFVCERVHKEWKTRTFLCSPFFV